MNKQDNSASINNHLQVIRETDSESKLIVDTLEQFKLSLQKMIDISSVENEWIKLIESMYDKISTLIEKQKAFKWEISIDGISLPWENDWEIDLTVKDWEIDLTEKDLKIINNELFTTTFNHSNSIISKVDSIFERLIKLKACSFNSDEYTKLKNELSILILWDSNLMVWFSQIGEPEKKDLLLVEYNRFLVENINIIKRNISRKSWNKYLGKKQKDNIDPELLNSIIDMLEAKFKIENIDLVMEFYETRYELSKYFKNLNLFAKNESNESVNQGEKIQSLIDEIATMITHDLPEIENLITEKIEWKI